MFTETSHKILGLIEFYIERTYGNTVNQLKSGGFRKRTAKYKTLSNSAVSSSCP